MNTPSDWLETTIGEIAIYVQRGKSPKYATGKSALPVVNQKAIRWFGIQEEHLKYVHPEQFPSWTEERFIKAGDVLWNSTGTGTVGRACLVKATDLEPPKVVDSHVTIVRPNGEIDPRFLFYWIMGPAIQSKIDALSTGSTNQVELNRQTVAETEFPLAPINEQHRIADKLDQTLATVERALERLRRVPGTLKRFRQSVLAAATDGRLTEDWRAEQTARMPAQMESAHYVRDAAELRYQVTSSPDSASSQPGSDSDWPEQTLADVANIIDPNPSHRYPSYENGTVPIIATEQLKGRDGYDLSRAKLVNPSFHDERVAAHGFEAYDIVFARKGRLGLARKPPVSGKYVFSHTIFLVRAKDPSDAEYLLWYLRNEQCIAWLLQEMNSNQGVPTLGKSFMQKLPVKMPPKDEQTEIVRRVEALFDLADRIEARHQTALARVEKLTQALLAKAFRGELVPQDPADEPAAALLERIRAARELNVPTKLRRRSARMKEVRA